MEDFKDPYETDIFQTLGLVPVIKVPDFIDFNTVYEFRGDEHITFTIVRLNDENIARVMMLEKERCLQVLLLTQ